MISAIIQARTSSTRLPNKILKKINNKFVLDYVINRVSYSSTINNIILATTTSKNDDVLKDYAIKKKILYYRGSENDVLSRYYHASKTYNVDNIVRITSDCPLIDYKIIDEVVKTHKKYNTDYTSNVIKRTFPRGFDVEIFKFDVLEKLYNNVKELYHREHVTSYIREHLNLFKLKNVSAYGKLRRPDIRLTLDTKEDFELIKKIILHFNCDTFTAEDIIDFLDANPLLLEINKSIIQKGVNA